MHYLCSLESLNSNWWKQVNLVGSQITKEIFGNNEKVWKRFTNLQHKCSHTSVSIAIIQKLHFSHLNSLTVTTPQIIHSSLQSPFYRKPQLRWRSEKEFWVSVLFWHLVLVQILCVIYGHKHKGMFKSPDIHVTTCSSDFTSPGSGRTAACNYWSNLGSVYQVPIMAGWTEAVWNTKFARHFSTWPALGIGPQTFWSWVPTSYPLCHILFFFF